MFEDEETEVKPDFSFNPWGVVTYDPSVKYADAVKPEPTPPEFIDYYSLSLDVRHEIDEELERLHDEAWNMTNTLSVRKRADRKAQLLYDKFFSNKQVAGSFEMEFAPAPGKNYIPGESEEHPGAGHLSEPGGVMRSGVKHFTDWDRSGNRGGK
ncbi:MAG: hypothetical protein NTU69_07995 [Proteobacteria bacterium]|nr:hypothetical protein [Pseudomonadota bacterium]